MISVSLITRILTNIVKSVGCEQVVARTRLKDSDQLVLICPRLSQF